MEVNKTLLEYMEHTTIGEAFKYLAPFLKLYSSYANNHENAINLLQVKKNKIYFTQIYLLVHVVSFPLIPGLYLASCCFNVF